MARWRLAAALMVTGQAGVEVDGLRSALGDRQLGVIGPHVTLVPPVNVREEDVPDALDAVRAAAAVRRDRLALRLGPVRTFAPANRVLYLAVEPAPEVAAVREAVRRGPLQREDPRPFVPHVTIDIEATPERLDAALTALVDYRTPVEVRGVTLLREHRDEERHRHWKPIADADFGRPTVTGRGGIEVELTTGTLVDPSTADALLPVAADRHGVVVVTARREGRPVGVAALGGRGADLALTQLVVAPDERGLGVGRALLAESASRAAAAGAPALVADGRVADVLGPFLVRLGWHEGGGLVRRLA